MVTRRVLLLSALVLLASLGAAEGAVVRGTWAPAIDARSLVEDAPLQLDAWRGRVVLLEFFGTECPHCRRLAPRMNAIHERYAPRGVTVLGLTPDAAASVQRFAREQRVPHPLARVPLDTLRRYQVQNYPVGVLVDPMGRVLWRGSFERLTDRVLDAYLERVPIAPEAPPAFAAVEADRRAGRYGAVSSALEQLRACRQIDRASCRYVLDTLAWVVWHQERAPAAAREDEARGRWASAVRAHEEIEAAYPGTELAAAAARARAHILADPTRAREIEARSALEAARRAGCWEARVRQEELLKAVAREHAGTEAGAEARALLEGDGDQER